MSRRNPLTGELILTRPATMEPSIRTVLGHEVHRRFERCRVCGNQTDQFLTGSLTAGIQGIWSWVRPHPRCVVGALLGRTLTRPARLDPVPDAVMDLGPVQIARAVATGDPSVRRSLREAFHRHARGDFGRFGSLDRDAVREVDPWCPGLFEPATRNALALLDQRGVVTSRFTLGPGGDSLLILTGLDGLWRQTVALPGVAIPELSPEDGPGETRNERLQRLGRKPSHYRCVAPTPLRLRQPGLTSSNSVAATPRPVGT